MRFSIAVAVVAISTLALHSRSTCQVSATLTPQERAVFALQEGANPNYCDPCIRKAMNNHFPHACSSDLNDNGANFRPSGPTDDEERCLCIAFQDLHWMKADCSFECDYVHNPAHMKNFLPASKIEGCDRWIDFETGEERTIEGFSTKDADHKPEIFEIAPPPLKEENGEEPQGFKISMTTSEDGEAPLESKEIKNDAEKKDEL